jgi:rod shape-determining protein MreC
MQQFIYFFQKFKYFLFFLLLQFFAITITFNNLNFHKSKYVNSANKITGGIYNQISNVFNYFALKSTNKDLIEENIRLINLLQQKSVTSFSLDSIIVDTVKYHQKYTFLNAKIINNNYVNAFNFLTIDKGEDDGLAREMAVVNGKGIIGITDNTSFNYTRVQSVLNRNSKINARLKNGYFGTLKWSGLNYNIVQLTDIPRQAPVKIGDTIETGGKSTIFPEGILIGTVLKINSDKGIDKAIDVKLFNDMSNIGSVYVIKNLHKKEIKSLENPMNE